MSSVENRSKQVVRACVASMLIGTCAVSPLVHAQEESPTSVSDADAASWMRRLKVDATSPQAKKYEAQAQARKQVEKDIRKLRLKHFGQVRSGPVRQEGLLKLRQYQDPALYPLLIEVFDREGDDVRTAVLDIFAESKSAEGDAALAWQAIFGRDEFLREESEARLAMRRAQSSTVNESVKLVVFEALRSRKLTTMERAAKLASTLQIIEAIPWLAAAQLDARPQSQNQPSAGVGSRNGALAWIVLGEQTAYIADLEPVTSEASVAFDPKVATITGGTVVRIFDAVVYTYRIEIHESLVNLASKAYGEPIDLGWMYADWRRWYKTELLPLLEERRQRESAAGTPPSAPVDSPTPAATPDPVPTPAPSPATDPAPPEPASSEPK